MSTASSIRATRLKIVVITIKVVTIYPIGLIPIVSVEAKLISIVSF